jgi:hypothetical protein
VAAVWHRRVLGTSRDSGSQTANPQSKCPDPHRQIEGFVLDSMAQALAYGSRRIARPSRTIHGKNHNRTGNDPFPNPRRARIYGAYGQFSGYARKDTEGWRPRRTWRGKHAGPRKRGEVFHHTRECTVAELSRRIHLPWFVDREHAPTRQRGAGGTRAGDRTQVANYPRDGHSEIKLVNGREAL